MDLERPSLRDEQLDARTLNAPSWIVSIKFEVANKSRDRIFPSRRSIVEVT